MSAPRWGASRTGQGEGVGEKRKAEKPGGEERGEEGREPTGLRLLKAKGSGSCKEWRRPMTPSQGVGVEGGRGKKGGWVVCDRGWILSRVADGSRQYSVLRGICKRERGVTEMGKNDQGENLGEALWWSIPRAALWRGVRFPRVESKKDQEGRGGGRVC